MAYVTGEVVQTPHADLPFKVVFKHGHDVIQEWPVESEEDGEQQIIEALRGLKDA